MASGVSLSWRISTGGSAESRPYKSLQKWLGFIPNSLTFRLTPITPCSHPPHTSPEGEGILPHTDGPAYLPRTATLSLSADEDCEGLGEEGQEGIEGAEGEEGDAGERAAAGNSAKNWVQEIEPIEPSDGSEFNHANGDSSVAAAKGGACLDVGSISGNPHPGDHPSGSRRRKFGAIMTFTPRQRTSEVNFLVLP